MTVVGDIFRSIFGGPNNDAPIPLFVDNPYRRRHSQPGAGDSPNTLPEKRGSDEHQSGGGGKRRKEGKRDEVKIAGEREALGDGGETPGKKGKAGGRGNGGESAGEMSGKVKGEKKETSAKKSLSVKAKSAGGEVAGGKGEPGGGEKGKKRKRGLIEEEYEARMYGAPAAGNIEASRPALAGTKRKTVENGLEAMTVSEEGYDNESRLQRTIFVGNLPLKVKKKTLLKEFKGFGEIESIRIRSVPILDTKIPRKGAIMKGKINEAGNSVHAYIVFDNEKSAEASLTHNMVEVWGNHIRVDRACPPRKKLKRENAPLYDTKRTAFIGNLPFDVKDEELYQLFSGINQLNTSVEAVRVIRDPSTSLGKGIAYVLFRTSDAANLAVRKKNLELRNRVLRIYRSKSDSTPTKRQKDSQSQRESTPRITSGPFARDNDEPKSKVKPATPSYQGLRATKSGTPKKAKSSSSHNNSKTLPLKRNREAMPVIVRKNKRPAVAARKANSLKGNSSSKKENKKRKPEDGTPGSVHRAKKVTRRQ